jgi:chromosome partitioning protein
MGKCISFHSYKGGTGKTTLATNFSFLLASKGYKVYLLDLDFYAPSLYSYFNAKPQYWINDYLKSNVSLDKVMINANSLISQEIKGDLFIGFAKGGKEDIYELEGNLQNDRAQQIQQFRNFISIREDLLIDKDADFVIMDTSPGIRYWSINSIVISDIILLTLKMGDIDLKGTMKMIDEIYSSLMEHGTVCDLLLNRVSGYCVPRNLENTNHDKTNISSFKEKVNKEIESLSNKSFKVNEISEIPCYCDIQFKEREYLTVKEFPIHPFTTNVLDLVNRIESYL